MNKVLKGLVAVAATAAMAIAGFAGAASATAAQTAGGTTKLTINGASAGDTFNIYRLLNATGDADAVAYYLRTDTRDAAPADPADSGVAATAKTITDGLKKDANVADAATIETATKTVTDFLGAKKNGNSSTGDITSFGDMDQWAKIFYTNYLKDKTPAVAADYTATVAEGATSATVSDIQAGYYMIIQTNAASDNAYSVAVVSTAYAGENGLTVTLKRDVPKLTKKVKDVNDSTGNKTDWQDSADYDVNDYVPFQLTGTMPKNIAAYTTYAYTFHDTMSEGLTFVNDKDHPVKVYAVNGETKTEIKTGYDVVTTGLANKETFNVKFADLKLAEDAKGTAITINENTKIVVEYYGQLNEQSKIGAEGNPNRAYLEYENNPEAEGEGTGKTPEDKVIVFTYEVDINKVDKDSVALEGATFLLEKKNSNGEWVTVAELEATQNGTSYTSKFQRVDDGTYRLTETKAPAGYTPIAPKEFTISAMHSVESDKPELTKFEITGLTDNKIENTKGTASADIVNTKGSALPSTGGMGTVMLYVAGVAVFVLAGATLVMALRRRNA
ncbi:fimbrial protein [Bifidobacteriaceae bacterium MCC01998]|nr:fimbrial protein [Bifidobacteriaceae bacterium MCC02037]GDZ68683.1 fimbrial protein [Bifidobacteriaceae bacterium MCC01988]GDZ74439.1 fimbrial protein [Bifidobacteriaceae bacterium MCC01998]